VKSLSLMESDCIEEEGDFSNLQYFINQTLKLINQTHIFLKS